VEVERPRLAKPDDVIVKVEACGVCGSDILRVMEKGAYHYPITIGHEFAGVVQEIGPAVKSCRPGDRVTVMPLLPCGECEYCRIGQYVVCTNYDYYGSRVDGAMAEYVRVSAPNILKIPEGVSFESAAMTDPVSIALHAVRKAGLEPGQTAAIFGMGAIGFLALQWLNAVGARAVYAVDVIAEKLDFAMKLGAAAAFNARETDSVKAIRDATGGSGVDVALEMAGSKIAQVNTIKSVRSMGTVIFCGISYDDLLIPNKELSKILRGELVLKGAWNSSIAPLPINEWETSLAAMAAGRMKTEPLISHHFRLEECKECFQMMYKRTQVFNKVMYSPSKR
jgi:L-iditol 2-dehydrogenase